MPVYIVVNNKVPSFLIVFVDDESCLRDAVGKFTDEPFSSFSYRLFDKHDYVLSDVVDDISNFMSLSDEDHEDHMPGFIVSTAISHSLVTAVSTPDSNLKHA